jgi:hypothetical protein
MKKYAYASTFCAAMLQLSFAQSAEMFQLRYNLTGTLGGEIFADPQHTGWFGGTAATHVGITQVTGDDGKQLRLSIPGGRVPLPAPAPAVLYPTYDANEAEVQGTGMLNQLNLAIGYASVETYSGGRIVAGINVPYAARKQYFYGTTSSPALNFNAAIPQPVQRAVSTQFEAKYQANLAQQGAEQSGEVQGWGDAEIQAGWLYASDRYRVLAGISLVAPTGKYSSDSGPDIGFGNFYTLRPAIQASYLFTPAVALAGKATWGINSRNKDNDLRSGDWVGFEAALAYKTEIGALGLHGIYVRQYEDDENNPFGPSKLRATNIGAFFTTKIPVLNAAVTIQSMRTTASRNSRAGNYFQARAIKAF